MRQKIPIPIFFIFYFGASCSGCNFITLHPVSKIMAYQKGNVMGLSSVAFLKHWFNVAMQGTNGANTLLLTLCNHIGDAKP
ncbi:MAG: hypothetical protein GX946_08180 [Oligosphaeraceae bacterium]|nr:hypothetical protein [Oligosphaeraceae bacterium]